MNYGHKMFYNFGPRSLNWKVLSKIEIFFIHVWPLKNDVILNKCEEKDGVCTTKLSQHPFISICHFCLSLAFASKAGAYPSGALNVIQLLTFFCALIYFCSSLIFESKSGAYPSGALHGTPLPPFSWAPSHFHPSLIFLCKAGAYPSGLPHKHPLSGEAPCIAWIVCHFHASLIFLSKDGAYPSRAWTSTGWVEP